MGQYGILKLMCWFASSGGKVEVKASSVRIDSSSYAEAYEGFDFTQAHDRNTLGTDHALHDHTVFPYTLRRDVLPYLRVVNSNLKLGPSDHDDGTHTVESDHDHRGIEMV